ncbi:MAG: GGDEF domain-containing protein [Actinomycetota bacterium]|nr:GGDEF domain-containing protein [Actinomycetota bacterium]
MRAPTGILLPESVLSSPWFMVLALIVAFNTIIYLGLTMSKLIPMPRQFHPSRVRQWLDTLGANVEQDPTQVAIPVPRAPESLEPHEDLRRRIARRDIPQAFGLFGIVIILITAASFLTVRNVGVVYHLIELGVGVAYLILASVTGRRHFRAITVMWTWAIANTVVVVMLCGEALVLDSQFPLAYALIAMTAFAPVTLARRPALISAAVMLAALVYASFRAEGIQDLRLIAAGLSALLVSGALLRLRLVGIDALADERARSLALATTDLLTGTLTRNGLLTLVPPIAGTAERSEQRVCVIYVDIDNVTRANQEYGIHYGDDVIKAVATAIEQSVRLGDLIARWEGDRFVVLGVGDRPDAAALKARIEESVRLTGVNLGKWPTTVSVGTAAGSPRDTTFEALLAQATTAPAPSSP